jgi:hypothetical protein
MRQERNQKKKEESKSTEQLTEQPTGLSTEQTMTKLTLWS